MNCLQAEHTFRRAKEHNEQIDAAIAGLHACNIGHAGMQTDIPWGI